MMVITVMISVTVMMKIAVIIISDDEVNVSDSDYDDDGDYSNGDYCVDGDDRFEQYGKNIIYDIMILSMYHDMFFFCQ